MLDSKNRLKLVAYLVVLTLVFVSMPSLADNGISGETRDELLGILTDEYVNLPNVEFEFGPPMVSSEGIEITSNKNLALSEANLSDGLVLGLGSYNGSTHLLMATALPDEMEQDYAAGLINLSEEEAVYVAFADLVSQDGTKEEIEFTLSDPGEGSTTLDFEVEGRKFLLKTTIPKSL